ncbi:MAG: Rieske (2Fe-2S) protein [Tepidiformaceae bacterium]
MSEVRVASLEDMPAGTPTLVEAQGTPVVLVRVGDTVYACSDICTHQGGPLSEGKLSGTRLACPWHGWMFDVKTGECVLPSRGAAVPRYPTRVDETGSVWVDLP